jgi:hypothetical protein
LFTFRLALTMVGLWACATAGVAHAQQNSGPASEPALPADLPTHGRAVELALDANYAVGGSGDLDLGGGAALRAGYAFPFAWAALVPEVGVDFVMLNGSSDDATAYGAFVGGRARFGRGLEPGISTHFGLTGVQWREDFVAPSADIGLFVELTYIERLILAAQGEYKSTLSAGGNPAITWYTAGITVGTRL